MTESPLHISHVRRIELKVDQPILLDDFDPLLGLPCPQSLGAAYFP